ncbi:MAG: hypothetical protein IKP92_06420 [Lachnospiraceae bacterium]|nr:hypothetical protein [Lachnospiraceae bacterium]
MKKKNRKNRITTRMGAVLLSLVFVCSLLSGCNLKSGLPAEILSLIEESSEPVSTEITTSEPLPEETPGEDPFNPDSAFFYNTPDPVWEEPSAFHAEEKYSLDEVPDISNTEEFNEYFLFMMKNRQTSICFNAKNGFDVTTDILLYRFSTPYVSTARTVLDENTVYVDINIGYYPGILISDAYLNNDTSGLDSDELQTYNMAKEFIEKTVLPEKDLIVRERLIHDYICSKTFYSNPGSREHMPRYCTAVGLLLDGAANCQGYTDCFYMLARMAGFEVEKQSGYGNGGMHVWNIIKIKGEWRAMDVTFDDTSVTQMGTMYQSYAYFNAGWDIIEATHRVDDGNELIPVTPISDSTYFYYYGQFPDTGYSSDLELAKKEIAILLDNITPSYDSVVSYMIQENVVYSNDIYNEIKLKLTVKHPGLSIYCYRCGRHTFVCAAPR